MYIEQILARSPSAAVAAFCKTRDAGSSLPGHSQGHEGRK